MKLQAIETKYAGCRFRSRLEARWAVFFDKLGIRWEYEPQGYMIGPEGDKRSYLPDFWLPDESLWIEVKGTVLDLRERLLMTHAVVTHPGWGLPNNENGVLLLGGIPDLRVTGTDAWHHRFEFYKGDLFRTPFSWTDQTPMPPREWNLACGIDCMDFEAPALEPAIGNGWTSAWNPSAFIHESYGRTDRAAEKPRAAYVAARSARFEHGESGR